MTELERANFESEALCPKCGDPTMKVIKEIETTSSILKVQYMACKEKCFSPFRRDVQN